MTAIHLVEKRKFGVYTFAKFDSLTPLSLFDGDVGGYSVSVVLLFLCLKDSMELPDTADRELGDRFKDVVLPPVGGPKKS